MNLYKYKNIYFVGIRYWDEIWLGILIKEI